MILGSHYAILWFFMILYSLGPLHEFADIFNGQCDFLRQHPITYLQTDACTIGLGAFFEGD